MAYSASPRFAEVAQVVFTDDRSGLGGDPEEHPSH
jgi:hypothetical protein